MHWTQFASIGMLTVAAIATIFAVPHWKDYLRLRKRTGEAHRDGLVDRADMLEQWTLEALGKAAGFSAIAAVMAVAGIWIW